MERLTQDDFRSDPDDKNRLIADYTDADGTTHRVEINLVPEGMIILLPGAPKKMRAAHVSLGEAKKVLEANPDAINHDNLMDDMLEKSVREANRLLENLIEQ